MNEPKRILQVLTIMNRGGAETMVMNFYRALDKSQYQFDFLVNRQERGLYDNEIESMGGRIFRAFPIRPWTYPRYFSFLDSFFKEHKGEYVAVHAHIQDNAGIVLKYAAKYGVERRICTSHIAHYGIDAKFLFRKFGHWVGNKYINCRLACGVDAGKFLYGDKPFEVMKNAIDTRRFVYDEKKNIAFRKERGWEDKIILGNVARFGAQKNHHGMLEIFKAVHDKNPKSILVLVGTGELVDEIKTLAKQKKLDDCVFFEGVQDDVSKYLNAFDILLFPSLFEGLPVSIIEAQAAGLKCFLSDTIDKDTDITGDVCFLSLKQSPQEWADEILNGVPYERHNNYQKIVEAGYDVGDCIDKLMRIYAGEMH